MHNLVSSIDIFGSCQIYMTWDYNDSSFYIWLPPWQLNHNDMFEESFPCTTKNTRTLVLIIGHLCPGFEHTWYLIIIAFADVMALISAMSTLGTTISITIDVLVPVQNELCLAVISHSTDYKFKHNCSQVIWLQMISDSLSNGRRGTSITTTFAPCDNVNIPTVVSPINVNCLVSGESTYVCNVNRFPGWLIWFLDKKVATIYIYIDDNFKNIFLKGKIFSLVKFLLLMILFDTIDNKWTL